MKLPLDKDSKIIIVAGDEYDKPNLHELLETQGAEIAQSKVMESKLYIDSLEPRNRAERRQMRRKKK